MGDEEVASKPGYWTHGPVPPNVRMGAGSVITGDHFSGDLAFKRFKSRRDPGIVIGTDSSLEGILFNAGPEAYIEIGDYCHFQDAFLISEREIRIGDRVIIGWHATIVDSDFHPVAPAERLADSIACSPLSEGRPRSAYVSLPVFIEDDVWIGPNATILKGVRVGARAVIEPGAVVTRDVPAGARVLGNPAQIIGEP
jgi:acetyltransferase-like isoleucine patch superfamily enzyme